MKSFRVLFHASLMFGLLAVSVFASENPDPSDPPGRVARLQYMTGQVSVQPHGTDDWVQGEANRPLTNADNVWADKQSRAELTLGTAQLRIDSESSLTLTDINTNTVQVSLHQGILNVHVRKLYGGEVYEIDTPNLAFTLRKAGDYRFDVDPTGDTTQVTVWKGEGEATGQGPGVRVHEGQQARFSGGTSLAHDIHRAPHPDGFDDWCRVRDERQDHSVSAQYVAPGVVGAEDLDANGTWQETPEYGRVWVPSSVAPGWAPYSDGQWAWEDPWGWTWVDAAPWGFAPFHYGRWVSWGGYWGWAPGPYWMRPWYAPALVSWWGGPGFGIGFGFGFGFGGGFGWCPLGFREPFFPWYHASPFYFRNVNPRIANFNHFSNAFFHNPGALSSFRSANMNRPGAFTAVSRNTLEHGLPVHSNSVHVSASQLQSAHSLTSVDAKPTRDSVLGSKAGAPAARPSSAAASRPTVSRMTPPATARSAATQAAMARSSATSSARSVSNPSARGAETSAPRGVQNSASSRMPEGQSHTMSSPTGHYVPRPQQSSGNLNNSAMTNRSVNGESFNRNAAKPSAAGPSSASPRAEAPQVAFNHSVPRPPAGFTPGRASASERGMSPSSGSNFGSSHGSPSSVPRPSGRVLPAPHSYSSSSGRGGYGSSGGYSSRSYGSSGGRYSPPSGGSYGGRGGYSAPSHSSGGGGSHGGSGSHSSGGGSHGGGHR